MHGGQRAWHVQVIVYGGYEFVYVLLLPFLLIVGRLEGWKVGRLSLGTFQLSNLPTFQLVLGGAPGKVVQIVERVGSCLHTFVGEIKLGAVLGGHAGVAIGER